ncbi:MAG: heliorhodopsin HeR [Dehalococcoidia bacterium]|nr:heliorhodopsin HeR [Dehalococcoidia bacterium]
MVNTQAIAVRTANRLRIFNAFAGLVHFIQAIAVLSLTNDFSIPVTAFFLTGRPGTDPQVITALFDFRIGWGVGAFLLMSATAHLILILPGVFQWYIGQLKTRRNYARWIEYSFSSSLMIVIIGMLPGITDISAMIALFGVNASMILFGLLMEKYEQPGSPSWTAFWFGTLSGLVPWIAIAFYLWAPSSTAEAPVFVYVIFFSLFIFFNSFALNMVFQYRQTWRWRNYLFGEYTYIFLSLTAKSLLAWQVFAGTLAGG